MIREVSKAQPQEYAYQAMKLHLKDDEETESYSPYRPYPHRYLSRRLFLDQLREP